jgi:hypothetical protein
MSNVVNDQYPGKNPAEMSNAELAQLAAQNYQSGNPNTPKSNYQFPTEIVDLPSKGLLYPEGNPLRSGKVEMKYMTAKEEDILTTQSYIKQGVVLDKLFQSLIVGNGLGERINYNDLLVCDKNAIMIAARVLGYGKDYEVEIETPSGNKQKETIDLTQFSELPLDESLYVNGNRFVFELPHSKRNIIVKCLTHKDMQDIEAEIRGMKKIANGVDTTLSTRTFYSIVSVDGNEKREFIRNFINNEMLAIDSRALRAYIKQITPDLDLNLDLIDRESGEPFRITLPIGVDFFWPSA